jgi:hypothetical protein
MKTSPLWQQVYANLSIIYSRLWELPMPTLDILLEKQFLDLRQPLILEDEAKLNNL